MSNINGKLLDHVLAKSFLESVIYTDQEDQYPIVAKFLSEFLGIVKNLSMDTKCELAKALRRSSVGVLSLIFLGRILTQDFKDRTLQKNMILVHLELLYYAFRRDMDYTRESFSRTNTADILDQIMRFPDSSTRSCKC